MFSAMSLEAQKLINVSIGKINASRVTRTGTSLHKSLLVASVLHKARNIYLEEERERAHRFVSQCPSPELTVTPVAQPQCLPMNDKENDRVAEHLPIATDGAEAIAEQVSGGESRLPLGEANNTGNNVTNTTNTTTTVISITNSSTNTTTSTSSSSNINTRKRRRVSDQETAAAISSILPKRLTSESCEDETNNEFDLASEEQIPLMTSEVSVTEEVYKEIGDKTFIELKSVTKILPVSSLPSSNLSNATSKELEDSSPSMSSPCEGRRSPDEDPSESPVSPEESDSDSEDAASDTSTSSCEEMEVDQLTSLVSFFSFNKKQKSDFCLVPIHAQSGGPHALALTA